MLYSAAPADTAAYWLKGRLLSAHVDRSNDSLFDAVKAIKESGEFGKNASPNEHAVAFYLLNHTASAIGQSRDPLEPLPEKELFVLQNYGNTSTAIAVRLFWYVLLITTREARHNNSNTGQAKCAMVLSDVRKHYPEATLGKITEMFQFTKSCPDASSILDHLLVEQTKGFPLGQFCKMLSSLYYRCSWGTMYGGPKWGAIADALFAFVSGEWSAEIFADTAFTLAHNTAPIFNKGMLYSSPKSDFTQILDVQRAGMMPQWLEHHGQSYQDSVYGLCKIARPDLFEGGPVDWKKVKALGAVGDYSHMIPKQSGKPPKGCKNQQIAIDHANSVWVLEKRAA